MHNPILLVVRKAIPIPTKSQRRHLYTRAWKIVCRIEYKESPEIFFEIGGGPIKTDAQFAALILHNTGPGEYSVLSWMKGRKGFRSFIHFIVDSEGYFQQIKKARVYKPKRKFDLENEYLKAKQEYQESRTEANWDELDKLQKKIYRAENIQGPGPYIASLQPRYKVHKIEGWKGFNEIDVDETDDEEEFYDKETVQETGCWSTSIEPDYVEQKPENENKTEMGFW